MNVASEESKSLLERARAWMEDDPDPATREELRSLVEEGDESALAERFAGPLEFGTAGLRGKLGAGPSRMNRATVAWATAGLARELLADVPDAAERGVVVGRDARRGSPELAQEAAEVLAGHGLRVHWIDGPTPTPVCAFAGRHLEAAGVVVVTASHNPPEYNGFKVYSEDGIQIVAPRDARIREEADRAGPLRALPRRSLAAAHADGLLSAPGEELGEAYLAALDAQCLRDRHEPQGPRAVTTALHGVGHPWVDRALRRRGFTDLYPVASQAEPDADFPTVRFPNPEEPGALDRALAEARQAEAELVLANDPDTDRLAVAVPDERAEGGWRVLTGDELGVLLADWLLGERARRGELPERGFVMTTVVSTRMLERIAAAHGVGYEETLTGFKWLWTRSLERARSGERFLFAFEEALGYCVGPAVRDKDGIGAAQALMECATALRERGGRLVDRLEELARAHGVHRTRQVSTRLEGREASRRMQRLLDGLRDDPPDRIGDCAVERSEDLRGSDADRRGLPRADVLRFFLEDGGRLVVRPSGTEPKLKSYLEVREPVAEDEGVREAAGRADGRLDELERWIEARVAAPPEV